MGKKETVDVLIEGGKASAAPPLGSSLGPLKVNIGQIVKDINTKTADFKGMKVPVKVTVDTETKEYDIEIGTPPAAELIKKEIGLKKGSGRPNEYKAGVIALEQVIKVAKMKQSSMFIRDLSSAVCTILGSCQAMGLLVDGKNAHDVIEEVHAGKHKALIDAGTTEVPAEKAEANKKIAATEAKKLEAFLKQVKAAKEAKEAKEAKAAKAAAKAK